MNREGRQATVKRTNEGVQDQHEIKEEYDLLVESLHSFAASVSQFNQVGRNVSEAIEALLRDYLSNPAVTITFGGPFKAGKSSLLNAALNRLILPVDDLPETGVICKLRPGSSDTATVVRAGGLKREMIPCTTEGLRKVTSRLASNGTANTTLADIAYVDITLADSTIPSAAVWVDTPGINDTAQMDARAYTAVRQSDVLLWVLTSRNVLSESEQAFLNKYIEARGPQAVLFVLNTFLTEDTEAAWRRFVQDKLTTHVNKLRSLAGMLGFTPAAPPQIFVASARAFADTGHGFGREALYDLLLTISTPSHFRVQHVRLFRAVRLLRQLASEVKPALDEARTTYDQHFAAHSGIRLAYEQAHNNFKKGVETAVSAAVTEWRMKALAACATLTVNVNLLTGLNTSSLGQQLDAKLANVTAEVATSLYERINVEAARNSHNMISEPDALDSIRTVLTPAAVSIEVVNEISTEWLDKAADAGSNLTARIPRFGVSIGNMLKSAVDHVPDKVKTPIGTREAIKASITVETTKATKFVEDSQERLVDYCASLCTPSFPNSGAGPSSALVQQLTYLSQTLVEYAAQADALARRAIR